MSVFLLTPFVCMLLKGTAFMYVFAWGIKVAGSLIVLAENVMGMTKVNDKGEKILEYGKR